MNGVSSINNQPVHDMAVHEITTPDPFSATLQPQQSNLALLDEAENTFLRDLPSLLESWKDYWVVYHGKERLGISYYTERLVRRFALPPQGRLSLWERCFGSKHGRFAKSELSLYFISAIWFETEFEITNEPWYGDDEPLSNASENQSPHQA